MNSIQPSLFSQYEDEILTEQRTFCIKHKYDPSVNIVLNVEQNEEPEHKALDELGYFVVTD